MPVPKNTRFRVKTMKGGSKIRLAFHKGKVIETKKFKNQVDAIKKRIK